MKIGTVPTVNNNEECNLAVILTPFHYKTFFYVMAKVFFFRLISVQVDSISHKKKKNIPSKIVKSSNHPFRASNDRRINNQRHFVYSHLPEYIYSKDQTYQLENVFGFNRQQPQKCSS